MEPLGCEMTSLDRIIFCICSKDTSRTYLRKIVPIVDGAALVAFTNSDTQNLPAGEYRWDIRVIVDPVWNDGETDIIDGAEIHAPFAATGLPVLIIREVGARV